MAMTSASHAEGRQFDPGQVHVKSSNCNPMQAEDHDRLGRNMISIVGPKPNPEELFNCRTLVSLFLWADVPPTMRAPIVAHESWVSLKRTHDSCAKIGVPTVGGDIGPQKEVLFFVFPFGV